MNPPAFWDNHDSLLALALNPLGRIYAGATAWRLAHAQPWAAPVPVICVGNLTAGGAGKTPVVRDLCARLATRKYRPAALSRGYGGSERGPLKVDPAIHTAAQVGDEPLLVARDAACWIAADRVDGAKAAIAASALILVMDDGLQNPGLKQDLRLIVTDGATGFGNRRAIPAGPLRETVEHGLTRASALIVIGEDRTGLLAEFDARLPVLQADLETRDADWLAGARVAGFAGIGRPGKFRDTLAAAGAEIAAFQPFPDHHAYRRDELERVTAEAARLDATAVTTEKDWVRLAPEWRDRIRPVAVALAWRDPAMVEALLDRAAPRV